jgi:hypothetical protein
MTDDKIDKIDDDRRTLGEVGVVGTQPRYESCPVEDSVGRVSILVLYTWIILMLPSHSGLR